MAELTDSETEDEIIISPLTESTDEPTAPLPVTPTGETPTIAERLDVAVAAPDTETQIQAVAAIIKTRTLVETVKFLAQLGRTSGILGFDLGLDRETFYQIAGEYSHDERQIDANRFGPEELRILTANGPTRVYIRKGQ